MANKDLFKQAIAEAKSVREAAIANAKEALEETLTPHLKDMLAAKLQEIDNDTLEEASATVEAEEVKESESKEDKKDEAIEENDGFTAVEEAEEDEEPAEDDSEESDDDAEDAIEEPGEEVEGEEQKQPKLKPGDRLPSKTLQKLVDAKYGQDCGDRESDFTCMVSFIGDFIADLDFGTKAKNGRRNWTGEQKEELAEWLEKLQKLVMATQRHDKQTVRGGFSKIVKKADAYFIKNYKGQNSAVANDIYEGVWRKIMKADRAIVLDLLARKADREKLRLENKFELTWNLIETNFRKYAGYMDLPEEKFTSTHATALEFLCEGNCGSRKIEVLDPQVKYLTWSQYTDWLASLSKTQPTVRFGDKDTPIVLTPVEAALAKFREENILVQVGVAKDKAQSKNRFLAEGDDRFVEGAVVIKPTIMFSAADHIRFVERVRTFFKLTDKNRPTDPRAREKMGRLIGTRLMRKVFVRDWPMLMSQAEEHGFELGSHLFRKVYASCLKAPEMGFLSRIYQLTGRRVDAAVLQAQCLRHAGSYSTVLAYSNLYIQWGLPPKLLTAPDKLLLRQLLERTKHLETITADIQGKQTMVNAAAQKITVVDGSEFVEVFRDAKKELSPERYLQFVRLKLEEAGIKITQQNLMKYGKLSKTTVAGFSKKNKTKQEIFTKKQETKEEKEEEEAFGKQNINKKRKASVPEKKQHPLIPRGSKVIIPQDERKLTNAKKQKVIDQRNNQKIKRDTARFGADNVTLAKDCDGEVRKAVQLAPKVTRDLCKEK